jgi:hypothetical protein
MIGFLRDRLPKEDNVWAQSAFASAPRRQTSQGHAFTLEFSSTGFAPQDTIVPMEFDYLYTPCALMQTVHILGNHHFEDSAPLQFSQCQMAGIGVGPH